MDSRHVDFLFISSSYDGGIGGHAAMLACQLQKIGHNVDLFKVPHIHIRNLMNPSFAILAMFKALFMQKRYDIVHAFNVPSALPMHYVNATAKVISVHGVYGEQMGMIHSKTSKKLASFAERKALKWADMLTTDSKRTADKYRTLGYNFQYLPSAIDLDMFSCIGHVKKRPGQVAYIGRDSYEKGTDILRSIEPDITGTIQYCTNSEWKDAMKTMSESSVLVLPSRMESLPTVVKEAFYLKVPVVATSVGGVPELIENGKTGFLADLGDKDKMIKLINGILDGSISTTGIVDSAYEYVTGTLTWGVVIKQYEEMYAELLKSYDGSRANKV